MTPPILYIAGPYNSGGMHKENITAASRISLQAWAAGWATICPHKNTAWFHLSQSGPSETVYLAGYLAILARSDAILMIPGWSQSSGAVAERHFAIDHCIPIYYYETNGIPPLPGSVVP